jgi:hypothetical protein
VASLLSSRAPLGEHQTPPPVSQPTLHISTAPTSSSMQDLFSTATQRAPLGKRKTPPPVSLIPVPQSLPPVLHIPQPIRAPNTLPVPTAPDLSQRAKLGSRKS